MTHLEMFRKILDDSGLEHSNSYEWNSDMDTITAIRFKACGEPVHYIEASFNKSGEFIVFDVWEDES